MLFGGKSKILSNQYQYEFFNGVNDAVLAKFKDTNQDNISNFKYLTNSNFFIRSSNLGFINGNNIEFPYVSYSQSDPVSFNGGVISYIGTTPFNGNHVYVLATENNILQVYRLYNNGEATYAQKCTGVTDSYTINSIFNELNTGLTNNDYVYLGATSSVSSKSSTATVNSTNVSNYSEWQSPVKISGISNIAVNKTIGIVYVTESLQAITLNRAGSPVGHTPVYADIFTDIRGFLGESLTTDTTTGLLCKTSTAVCSADLESIDVIYNHSNSTKIKLLDQWCFFDGATGYIYRSINKGNATPISTQIFIDVELAETGVSDSYNRYLGLTAEGEVYIVSPNETKKIGSTDDGIYVAIHGKSATKQLFL